jgi:hypothetical protein
VGKCSRKTALLSLQKSPHLGYLPPRSFRAPTRGIRLMRPPGDTPGCAVTCRRHGQTGDIRVRPMNTTEHTQRETTHTRHAKSRMGSNQPPRGHGRSCDHHPTCNSLKRSSHLSQQRTAMFVHRSTKPSLPPRLPAHILSRPLPY